MNVSGHSIREEVRTLDPNVVEGSEDFDAECVCLLLAVVESDGWNQMEIEAADILSIPPERAGQFIANLRLGECLTEEGYLEPIQNSLAGNDGGMTLMLLSNVASGRMKYYPETNKWALTAVGIAATEKLLKGR